MVGAVVLAANGQVVGMGFHERAGGDHAEILALDSAGDNALGGTLYVSLEPCSHFGKTPPCVQRIVASGVSKVVAGMVDPNPLVCGAGLSALQDSGIEVVVGVLEKECRWLNRGFVKRINTGLPWLCLKLAATLDGKIADREGSSRWISGPEARAHVHQLRNIMDCVLVGGTTARRDDPELNVRNTAGGRNPCRAVLDPNLELSPQSRLCQSGSGGQTTIFCLSTAHKLRADLFPEHVRIVPIDNDQALAGNLHLETVLRYLSADGNLTVLCEGGGKLAAALIAAGLVDELHWIASPSLLPDEQAVPAIAPLGEVTLGNALKLKSVAVSQLGQDILIQGTFDR